MNTSAPGQVGETTGAAAVGARSDVSLIARLAFGRAAAKQFGQARHLALLPQETLELDLDDPAQREFGDYELLELIGEGGMGVVYRARQLSLEREVAVKLLAAGPWASPAYIERFRREAQNAARMQHPNIVAIYEVGSAEEMHFFSMRLVRGGSLAELIARESAVAPLRAAKLLRIVAEAVDYAHRLGVLHLDLKPANVLIDEGGAPHVADFGLARRLDHALAADAGEISGTPSYMAPEQASPHAAPITPATDIWGLGAILYELVTGVPPFLAGTPQSTLALVRAGTLRAPREHAPQLPRDLEAVILKCMARTAGDRYASARELADDLTRVVEGREVRARPLRTPQRLWRWARREPRLAATALLAFAALLSGLIATTQQWRRADANARLAASSAALANERLWQARIDQAAISVRDGHGYDALPGLAANIVEREAGGLPTLDDRIRAAAVERSVPRLIDAIALGSTIVGIALSPDGRYVAAATEDENLRLFDTETGERVWQTGFSHATHFFVGDVEPIRLVLLRFSADGRYIVGRNHPGLPTAVTPLGYDEVLFDAATGPIRTPPAALVPHFRDATFSPDGQYAIVRGRDSHGLLVRTADWRALGAPFAFEEPPPAWLVTNGARHVLTLNVGFVELRIRDPATYRTLNTLSYPASSRITTWASSPDGNTVILGHVDGRVERLDCATGATELVTPDPIGRIGWVAFSPDGAWFGAVADSGEVLVWDSATRRLAAPSMRLATTAEIHRDQLFLDAAARTVLASSDFEMGLWYLPDAVTAPVRLSGEFPHANAWWLRAFAHAAREGLIATDAGRGELRLWRAQQLAPRGPGPPLPASTLRAASGVIPIVEDRTVRLIHAADARPLGAAIELSQPVRSAELTTDEAGLVVLAGRELSLYDLATASVRVAPVVLPNDPARLVVSPDSRRVLVLTADYADGVNREVGQIWDLAAGSPASPAAAFDPMTHFEFSTDAHRLLAWSYERLQVHDAATLAARWPAALIGSAPAGAPVPGTPQVAITDAHFSADGTIVDALTGGLSAIGELVGASSLVQFDAATGAEVGRTVIAESGGATRIALLRDRRHAIVARQDVPPLWWDQVQGASALAPASPNEYGALALAGDGSLFARAGGMNLVTVVSTADRAWLTPALPTAVPTEHQFAEFPTELALTRDNAGLIGRTRTGEMLYWDIRPDLRPAAQIVREAELVNPNLGAQRALTAAALSAVDRAALRAGDPGRPVYAARIPQARVPERPAGLPDALFDLGPYYNVSLPATSRIKLFSFRELTPGLHRFLGVDYDIRGFIQLAMNGIANELNPEHPPPQALRGIRPGLDRFAALDLLVAAHTMIDEREPRPLAIVELEYRDASRVRLPLVCLRDTCSAWSEEEGRAGARVPPVAWRSTETGASYGMRRPGRLYAMRVLNPHPERRVAALALESTNERYSTPMFFAITAEPVGDAARGKVDADAARNW